MKVKLQTVPYEINTIIIYELVAFEYKKYKAIKSSYCIPVEINILVIRNPFLLFANKNNKNLFKKQKPKKDINDSIFCITSLFSHIFEAS